MHKGWLEIEYERVPDIEVDWEPYPHGRPNNKVRHVVFSD